MEEFLGEMNFGFEFDSVMMRLLRSAMDKADQRLRSKGGPIEKLNEQSKFYELAIIQLKGSLKLIQEETDSYSLESSHEKIISDLMEIKDRLKRRVKETKLAISRIDTNLMKRLDLEIEGNFDIGVHEGKERDFSELKNSVDLQVLNIKQKLEDERINLTSGMRKMSFEPNLETFSGEMNWGNEKEEIEMDGNKEFEEKPANYALRLEQNIVIEKLSSNIDILKGTLDLAFGMMQKAESCPLEKQWRWTMEKETMSILIRGFMSDIEGKFGEELGRKGNEFPLEFWNEITSLHSELKGLCTPNEIQTRKVIKGQEQECLNPSPHVRRTSSEPLPEFDYTTDTYEEDVAADGSHYVAKMIKSHESIIRKQSEEWNWLKREILKEKWCLSMKKGMEPNSLMGRIREVVVRLDSVMKWKAMLEERKKFQEKGNFQRERKSEEKTKVDKERREVEQERDDLILKKTSMDETYITLLKGLVKEFHYELSNYDTEGHIRDDRCLHTLREIVNDWMFGYESKILDRQISNDIYHIICNEAAKDFVHNHEYQIVENKIREEVYEVFFREMVKEQKKDMEERNQVVYNETVESQNQNTYMYLESLMKEELYIVFLREMIKERKMEREAYNFENLIREEIYDLVIVEAVKDVHEKFTEDLVSPEKSERNSKIDRDENVIQSLNSLLKSLDAEENLTLRRISEIKKYEALDEHSFTSVTNKFEKSMKEMIKSKELMRELGHSLGISDDDLGRVDDQITPILGIRDDEKQSFCQTKGIERFAFQHLQGFAEVLTDFERVVHEKSETNFLRLDEVKHQIDQVVQLVGVQRKRELRYKKAFLRRCHNLRLAETEVDLLGDQVEVLLGLLEKIYLILDQYSPVLSCHFGVSDILKLIKKELTPEAVQ